MKKSKVYKPISNKRETKKFNGRKDRDALYGHQWSIFRKKFLRVNPDCYTCGAKANVIDHIVVHKGDPDLFWKHDNLMPLCKFCHDTITGLFDNKPVQELEGKYKWIGEARLRRGLSNRIKVVDTSKHRGLR